MLDDDPQEIARFCVSRSQDRVLSFLVTNLAQLPKEEFLGADSLGLLCHHSSTNREQIAIRSSRLAMDWLRLRVELG
jgi:hypothetical protein